MKENKLESYQAFVKVAELKGFSKAAEALDISKAQVSRHITRLEAFFGVQLFVRSTRAVVITEQGESFYWRIKQCLESFDEAEQYFLESQNRLAGTLRITAAGIYGETRIAAAVSEFMLEHPELRVELEITSRQVNLISEGFDLAIRSGVLKDSDLKARKIDTRQLLLCASPEYIQAHGKPISLEELNQHNCLRGGQPAWHFNVEGKGRITHDVNGRWLSNNGAALLQATLNGLGIAQLPEHYVRGALDQGTLVTLLDEYQPSDDGVWAIYPNTRYVPLKLRLFLDHLVSSTTAA